MKTPSQMTTRLSRTSRWFGATLAFTLAMLQVSHAAILHHWDFNTDGTDSISGSNVTLVGTATISGGALNIPGGAVFVDYGSVNLAATLANNPTLTVECWYTQNALTAWSKVWMFGFDNAGGQPQLSYIDYTPYTGLGGNPPKIDFDPNDNTELNAPGITALNAGQEYHAVTVYDAGQNRMSMWINGVLIATNTMGGETIQNLGFNTARFGSGFFYGDPELTGAINDIRIYNNALGALQIAVNFAAGANTVISSYVPSAVHLNAGSTTLLGGQTEQVDVTADFGSLLGVEVTVAATNWVSSNPSAVTVNQSGLITAVGAGSANISATVAGVTGSIGISVSAVQPSITQDLQPLSVFIGSSVGLTVGAQGGNLSYFWYKNNTLVPSQTTATFGFPAVAPSDVGNYSVTVSNQVGTANSSTVSVSVAQQTLDHRYSMDDANVTDSIGGANGAPVNNITFSGGQAIFPGTSASGPAGDYINLPGGLISGYSSVTFEIWATIQPNGAWNQICAFGDQAGTAGNTYLALIPHSGPNDYRMTIRTLSNERATAGATPVDTSVPVHLVGVYNADTSNEVLYANGRQVSSRSTPIDIANVNNLNSWLGRSLFDGDAGMKGSIDEFRIWNGPLTPLHIAVNDGLGPNSVNTNPGAFLGLTSISVGNTTMVGGTSQQATALAGFANIANVPFNSQVTNWVSSNTNVVTVNANGLITAVGSGSSTVSATALGSTANIVISVLAVQPTISQQPVAQTRFLGGSAQFSVVAAGGQLTYQWLKNGTAIGNATTNPLALVGLVSGDAADYRVVVTNSAGSVTSSIAHLTVSALPAGYAGAVMGDGPVAYWRLNESSGTTMVDSYNLNDGIYSGAVTQATPGLIFGGADASATFNSGATINGTGTVPFNSSLNPSTFTVEFWANPLNTTVGGQYVVSLQDRASGRRGYAVQFDNITSYAWDFTLGTNNTLFTSISSPPPRVKAGTLYHVVASYDGTTARLYVNGTLVSSLVTAYQPAVASTNLTIASRNGNNFTRAVIDDVALYNYALSSAQVANHYALGRSGTFAATIVSNPVPAAIKSVVGARQSFTALASGQSPLALQWLKNGVPVPGATGQTLTLSSLQLSDAGSYSLRASNAVAGAVTSAAAVLTVANQPFLVHRWSFDDGTDSVSGSNATLFGSAAYSGTGQLVLSDGGHFASYANVNIGPTFASSPSLTFEGWYVDNAAANWAKVWMFGLSTANYIDYTPHRGDANHQASMSFNPLGAEVNTANLPFEPPVLTPTQLYHVVAAYDSVANIMNLYLDGVLVATNNMAGTDLTLIQADQGYIGASLFADPDLAGSIDELRVWRGALSPAQVAATHFAGPSSVPNFNLTLSAQLSGGNLIVTWPSGTLLQAPSVTGPWTPVSGAAPPSYSVPVSGAPMKFYRVQVQ
jgi:hypothetical protein